MNVSVYYSCTPARHLNYILLEMTKPLLTLLSVIRPGEAKTENPHKG